MVMTDAGGGVEGLVNVGVWGDGIATACGCPGLVLREIGMIVLGVAVDWFPPSSLVASVLSLCSLVWLTLRTTLSELMISLIALIISASSALEPDSEELASSMGERGACSLFSSVAGSTGASYISSRKNSSESGSKGLE